MVQKMKNDSVVLDVVVVFFRFQQVHADTFMKKPMQIFALPPHHQRFRQRFEKNAFGSLDFSGKVAREVKGGYFVLPFPNAFHVLACQSIFQSALALSRER